TRLRGYDTFRPPFITNRCWNVAPASFPHRIGFRSDTILQQRPSPQRDESRRYSDETHTTGGAG
ncbi:MAG: hypothetical protein KC940_02525, partial [Candidatus Omnitrophica bacterium]|nr:hypothetical protein [Candidatus Omnitrophota bacterium]